MSNPLANKDMEDLARRIAELTNGGSVTQRCVSLSEGALSPDLRVNYEFGLVLGVDEFRQEQLYHLEKDYQHNRALHGYGTVYGLRVTTTRPGADTDDVLITVEPGMAIDQWGRAVIVRDTQCARLGAWLTKHTPPSQGPSGELSVYVVLHYDECPDVLQPIPGQPCSGSDTTQAASRIRDSFHIELLWEAPAMQAWRAVQRFARLLAAVRIEPDLPPDLAHSDEATIIEQVKLLDMAGESLFDPGGAGVAGLDLHPARDFLLLPSEGARDALDRIFVVWTTEVRHKLHPDLSDPAGGGTPNAPGVVLARIDFVGSSPYIDDASLPSAADNSVRPFLLHTQLIQELLLLGDHGESQQEFVTLKPYGTRVLHAWVHYPGGMDIPLNALRLTADGRPVQITSVRQLGKQNLFEIVYDPTAPIFFPIGGGRIVRQPIGAAPVEIVPLPGDGQPLPGLAPGARLALTFLLDRIDLEETGRFLPVLGRVRTSYLGYDYQTNAITAYTIVSSEDQEFATIQARGGGVLHAVVNYPDTLAVPDRGALRVRSDGQELDVIAVERLAAGANRFKVIVGVDPQDLDHPGDRPGRIAPGARVELALQLDQLKLDSGTDLLPELDRHGMVYAGRVGDLVIVDSLSGRVGSSRELVSIAVRPNSDSVQEMFLWFHPNTTGAVNLPHGPNTRSAFRVWSEDRHLAFQFQIDPVDPEVIDGETFATEWRLILTGESEAFLDGERLAFTFYPERIRVAPHNITLADQIRQYRLAFVGYNGNDRIRTFYRVELPPRPQDGGGLTEEQVRAILRETLLQLPTLPFVTVTPFAGNGVEQPPRLQLWFHLDQKPEVDEIRMLETSFDLLVEFDPPWRPDPSQRTPVPIPVTLVSRPQHNVFIYAIDQDTWSKMIDMEVTLRFCRLVFTMERSRLGDAEEKDIGSLAEYVRSTGIKFEGHNGGETIVAYVRIPDAPRVG